MSGITDSNDTDSGRSSIALSDNTSDSDTISNDTLTVYAERMDDDRDKEEGLLFADGPGSVEHLKDLLTRLSPMITLSGTSENTPEMLMFLSDTEPNFHTLKLVKSMRSTAREQLEPIIVKLVEEYLDQSNDRVRESSPVQSVLHALFQEPAFHKFVEVFQERLLLSSDYLHRNFDKEMVSVVLEFCLSTKADDDNAAHELASNNSSLNSSLNQSGFLFLSPNQYETIASSLNNKQLIDKWPEYLNKLLSATPGEPVLQQCWFEIKKGLQTCLLHPLKHQHEKQHEIFIKSLKIHSRLLTSQTQSAVVEANLNLLETASEFWYSKKLSKFLVRKSSVIDTEQSHPLLQIIRLLLIFQNDAPLLWIRYPEHLSVMLIERWLTFLTEGEGRSGYLSSNDMVCLLDPEALWLKHWLHAHYSRSKVCSSFEKSSSLLRVAVQRIQQGTESKTTSSNQNTGSHITKTNHSNKNKLSRQDFYQLRFLYRISFVLELMKYRDCRTILNSSMTGEDKLTCEMIIRTVYKFVWETKNVRIANIVRRKIEAFVNGSDSPSALACKAELVRDITDNLLEHRHNIDREAISIELKILHGVMNTGTGLSMILLGNEDNGLNKLTTSPDCDRLLQLFGRLLVEEYQMSLNYAITFEMATSVLCTAVGRHLYAGHKTYKQTLTNLTSLYHRSLLGLLEAVADGTVDIEHRQSLLRQTAATALSKGRERPLDSADSDSSPDLDLDTVEENWPEEEEEQMTLAANVVAILCSTEHGIVALDSVTEEDPTLLWLDSSSSVPPLTLLACVSSSPGVSLLLRRGLRPLAGALFSERRIQQREASLILVAAAGGRLDARLLLQDRLGYQEELKRQQQEQIINKQSEFEEDGNEDWPRTRGKSGIYNVAGPVMVDECSLLRLHILRRSAHLGTERAKPLPVVPPTANQHPDQVTFDDEVLTRHPAKRQGSQASGLYHYLLNSRAAVKDTNWLIHCRKHFQAAVIAGDVLKSSQVLDMLEWSLEAQQTAANSDSTQVSQESRNRSGVNVVATMLLAEALHRNDYTESITLAAIKHAQKYALQLELVSQGRWSRERLRQLLSDVQRQAEMTAREAPWDRSSSFRTTDWMTIILYILSDCQPNRAATVAEKLSTSAVSNVVWAMRGSSDKVIRVTKILMSLHFQDIYDALQHYSAGGIWSILRGWLDACMLGVLPWTEVCHWLLATVLLGPDYCVYLCLLLLRAWLQQLHRNLSHLPSISDKLLTFQTGELQNFKLSDHLQELTELNRIHKRLVLHLIQNSE